MPSPLVIRLDVDTWIVNDTANRRSCTVGFSLDEGFTGPEWAIDAVNARLLIDARAEWEATAHLDAEAMAAAWDRGDFDLVFANLPY